MISGHPTLQQGEKNADVPGSGSESLAVVCLLPCLKGLVFLVLPAVFHRRFPAFCDFTPVSRCLSCTDCFPLISLSSSLGQSMFVFDFPF